MKIACIDKTAADRLSLQERLEQSYFAARSALGHLPVARVSPVSKEELLIGTAPEAALVGPGFSVEEASACCREITSAHPALPLIIIVRTENFSLRTLRRFEFLEHIVAQHFAAVNFVVVGRRVTVPS